MNDNIENQDLPEDAAQNEELEIAQTEQAEKEDKTPLVLTEEEEEDFLRLLEALLFTASDMVTINELQPFFPPRTPIAMLLERLETMYAERGVQVVQRGNGFGFRTAADLGERLQIRKSETRPMSRPVIETLAIIAYHQPVTKAEIEQIRGVSVGKNVLENLLEQNLIKPGKRREVPGRPLTWMTSQHFLDMFSLTSLKDLPNLQEMKDQGLLTVTPPNFNLQATLNLDGEEHDDAEDAEQDNDDAIENELSSDDDSGYNDEETTEERETA
ncbi:MAG TPA: SMC-Scp complex subunit ScpB [Alphaproteobacteria bacterium]